MSDGGKPTCFVVMGFGKKTDYATGRTLDLDKTYKHIIKPTAEEAGYECVRADEIQHAGVIDVPMYERLLNADLVIADLSTSNVNAFFELGVRYALRPRTTIVIAEEELKNPFDTNHISFRRYRHDGEALDIDVVEAFRPKLEEAVRTIAGSGDTDSPVYTFIPDLTPPKLSTGRQTTPSGAQGLRERTRQQIENAATEEESQALQEPMALLMRQASDAVHAGQFGAARAILEGIRYAQGEDVDDFVMQQLALATYKSKQPAEEDALLAARDIVDKLDPNNSFDPETIGLWAAIHKRLAELNDRATEYRKNDIDVAIDALERGFHLKRDYYNGINLAYLLNIRSAGSDGNDAITDRTLAERVRQRVIEVCNKLLEHPFAGEDQKSKASNEYWTRATLAEAYAGLGDETAAAEQLEQAAALPHVPDWMLQSTQEQIGKLRTILKEA